MTRYEAISSPEEFISKMPMNASQQSFVEKTRNSIVNILNGTDPRLLIITGPCSIHDVDAAIDYALKLKEIQSKLEDSFLLIMRVYVEKPRTSVGWKGLVYDPLLDGSHDINTGLKITRKLLLALTDLQVGTATEFLEPAVAHYYSDLISWGSIGARTTMSQTHRQLASSLEMPIGFKNNIEGSIEGAINALISASSPHTYIGTNPQGQHAITYTEGNPYTHIVLRGLNNKPNYDPLSVSHVLNCLKASNLPMRLMIDCSHDNSSKNHEKQPFVFLSVINQIAMGNKNIIGIVLESNLSEGNQQMGPANEMLRYGISVTDPCIDWLTTEKLLNNANEIFKKKSLGLHNQLVEAGACDF